MKNLDCRGLACPGPVIQVKKALDEIPEGGSFTIELDSVASKDNVLRFARSRGAVVSEEKGTGGDIRLIITAPLETEKSHRRRDRLRNPSAGSGQAGEAEKMLPVVLITGDTLGKGDDKLGRILIEGFINTLLEQDRLPDQIVFLNTGVKLSTEGSAVLGALRKLTDQGCEVLVCGTCLDFYSIKEQLAVGIASNMYDIQKILLEADSVIKL